MKSCKYTRRCSAHLIGYSFSVILSLFVSLGVAVSPAYAQITGSGDIDNYTYTGGFTARQYSVYVPPSYDGSTPAPMIFALHGCAMDHVDAMNLWNLDVIADQNNVILVFPFVTSFGDFSQRNENCWGYWLANHVQEGDGNDGEVDDLYAIAQEVESRYQIDSERRFITGLSGGGAMAIAEAIAYNDYWTAAAPVAGLAYGDGSTSVLSEIFNSVDFHVGKINTELNFNKPIPMLVVQSSNDTVVRPRAMELIRDSQLTVWGGDLNADGAEDCARDGVSCTLTTYNGSDGLPLVKTLVYSGLPGRSATYGQGHYWTGGDENQNVWSKASGPSASEHMWDFFSEVSGGAIVDPVCEFDDTPPAAPTGLSAVDPRDMYAVLSVNANAEEDLRGYKVYRTSGSELTPSPISSTTITVTGLSAQTQYDVYATAVDNCGNESTASGSVVFTTTALEYVAPSASGTATEHYLAGRLDVNEYIAMGAKHGYINSFTLWQQKSGTWSDVNPNGNGDGNGGDNGDNGDDGDNGNGNNNGEPGSWTTSPSLNGMEVHVYSPNSSTSNGKRALMITLHGCSQSNEQVRDSWGWTDEADQYGMVIAAPMAPNGGVLIGCWDYYGSNHSASNPGRHDDNLIDLANSLMANTSLNIDPDQVYISGLSSGGGQTFVMGCLAPEIFAGIGINAGPALGTSSGQIGSVPFGTSASSVASICTGFSNSDGDFNTQLTSVVHGNSDTLVGTAYAAVDSEAMARVYGASKNAGSSSISGGGTEETWSDNEGVRVSKITVSGLSHAWPAGSGSSGGGQYTNHSTIDYPAFLTQFLFDNNRRANFSGPHPTPSPTITPMPTTTPNPTITPTPVVTPTPSPTPISTPVPACEEVSAFNYYHKVGGRATSSGAYFSPNYVANGSNDTMPGSTWGLTNLYSFDGAYWRVGSCP